MDSALYIPTYDWTYSRQTDGTSSRHVPNANNDDDTTILIMMVVIVSARPVRALTVRCPPYKTSKVDQSNEKHREQHQRERVPKSSRPLRNRQLYDSSQSGRIGKSTIQT